jgi:hypothetical protein
VHLTTYLLIQIAYNLNLMLHANGYIALAVESLTAVAAAAIADAVGALISQLTGGMDKACATWQSSWTSPQARRSGTCGAIISMDQTRQAITSGMADGPEPRL